jgi:hypothetical protein
MRAFGLGFNSFLNDGKMEVGICPLEDAVGGVCGGCTVAGGVVVRLKAVLSRIPREYASYGPAGKSRKVLYPDF